MTLIAPKPISYVHFYKQSYEVNTVRYTPFLSILSHLCVLLKFYFQTVCYVAAVGDWALQFFTKYLKILKHLVFGPVKINQQRSERISTEQIALDKVQR